MAAHDARAIASFGLYDNDNGWVIPATDDDRADKWGGILTYGLFLTVASAAPHVFDGTAYPALPQLIRPGVSPPTPREEQRSDVTQLNAFLRQTFELPMYVVNALQRGVCDGLTFSRHTSIPDGVVDGAMLYFEDGVVGSGEGLWALEDGTWNKVT